MFKPESFDKFGKFAQMEAGQSYKVWMFGDRSSSWIEVPVQANSPEQAALRAMGMEGMEEEEMGQMLAPAISDIPGVHFFYDQEGVVIVREG